jgi:hypothetical protein
MSFPVCWPKVLLVATEGQTRELERVLGEDRSLYSFAICDVMLARDAATFRLDVFRHHLNPPAECVYSQRQPGLQRTETVPIPRIPYALKLDEASPEEAVFCVCRPEPPEA